MPPLADLRILLVQARTTRIMELQELCCFQARCRLQGRQFRPVNVVRDRLTPELLDGVDALMIGGAGEFSAADEHPWTTSVLALCRAAAERALPTFGSCWGHQILARAFGGTVIHDPEKAELGSGEVMLTDAGRHDALFGRFPSRFRVNMGHHDRVAVLPPGGVELAFSDSQPHQAFRLGDLPIYGTQFHSELDAATMHERLVAYRAHYAKHFGSEEAFQAVIDRLLETTEADHLLHDFLVHVVVR